MLQINREAELGQLRAEAELAGVEVFGEGNPNARLMLVGEAPGKTEVAQHRAFIGPAGRVLTDLLDRLAIPRDELWITNVVKIRPFVETCRSQANRRPRAGEIRAHDWILRRELAIIRPRVVVCLGGVAASALIHPNFKMKQERGCWFPGPEGSRFLATYHPSYLLHLHGAAYEAARDDVMADLTRAWGAAQGESGTGPAA